MSDSICVYDLCAQAQPFPVNIWADWHPDTQLTVFGGDWWEIPDRPGAQPTEAECLEWVESHIPSNDVIEM